MNNRTTRRDVFIAAGLGLVAGTTLAGGPASADATAMGDTENANVKLVKDFFAAWNDPNVDLDKLTAQYIAPNAAVRWTADQPAVMGPAAAAIQVKAGFAKGMHVEVDVQSVFAHGPVVATWRVDTLKTPGAADQSFKVVGIHVVKGGKFAEYTDYVVS